MATALINKAISNITEEISICPCHYVITLDDEGHLKSIDKIIDEPFRKIYDRDMRTLQQLILLRRIKHETLMR